MFNYCSRCWCSSSTADAPLDAKKLKIGTELTAKVQQIRAHGLVLDCGSDIRGMYRFEVNINLLSSGPLVWNFRLLLLNIFPFSNPLVVIVFTL